MRYFQLNMGEGIAGPATIGAGTTVIYSCMGIAFVNRPKKFGGMYHYPAKNLSQNVTATIRQMVQDIQPTEISLTPASSDGNPLMGSRQDDIEAVIEYLGTLSTVKVEILKSASTANLIWIDGVPKLNASIKERRDVEPEHVNETIRSKMSSGKRELEGDVWYYGGDGETRGVLEQGLTTANSTKRSSRKQCIIL